MGERVDAYAVLQVVPTAHPDVIRAAYRALARNYHPDRSTDPADAQRMIELNAAFELVGTPARRAAYDLARDLAADADADDETAANEAEEPPTTRRRGTAAAGGRGGKSRGRGRETGGTARGGANSEPEVHSARDTTPDVPPPPPGPVIGSVLDFGRYKGWSLGQIARVDTNYLEWFRRTTIGRRFQAEIEDLLEPVHAASAAPEPARTSPSAPPRRGWLRRRG